jgi:hypothetical protein
MTVQIPDQRATSRSDAGELVAITFDERSVQIKQPATQSLPSLHGDESFEAKS